MYLPALYWGLLVASIVLAAADVLSSAKRSIAYPIIASAVATLAALLLYIGPFFNLLALLVSIAILSTMLASYYITKTRVFIGNATLLILGVALYLLYEAHSLASVYYGPYLFSMLPLMGVLGIGAAAGLTYARRLALPNRHVKRELEVRRDLVHMALGVIVLSLIMLLVNIGYLIISVAIVAALIAKGLLVHRAHATVYEKLSSLERENTPVWLGALSLAAGTALMIGFVRFLPFMLVGISALFFADPIATVAGLYFGDKRLPYNRNKSYVGSAVFFLVAAAVPFIIFSTFHSWIYVLNLFYAPSLSAVFILPLALALVESAPLYLDDNVTIAIATILLSILAYAF